MSSSEPHPVTPDTDMTNRAIAKRVLFTAVKLSAAPYNADKDSGFSQP
jgi:hypothetical protein